MHKRSAALGSALPDPVRSADAVSPIPSPVVANKTAPGRRGPIGLSPRTTYSRVNTGPPPVPEAGAGAQKGMPPRGMEFLPAKTAQTEDFMTTMAQRPILQDMLKAAMEGTASKIEVTNEAARQLSQQVEDEQEKTSSEETPHYSTELVTKLASALDFIATQMKTADKGNVQMPGVGPGTLGVLEATSSEKNIDAGEGGQATAEHQVPKDPPTQKEEVQVGKANTGLQSNDDMSHPEQPRDPWKNERASLQNAATKQPDLAKHSEVQALYESNLDKLAQIERFGGKKAPPYRGIARKGEPPAAMQKTAKEPRALRPEERHYVRRALLGTPISAAIEAKKGQKGKAFGEAVGHYYKKTLPAAGKGLAVGVPVGAALGAAVGGKGRVLRDAGLGALGGGYLGALGGGIVGGVKGHYGREASIIHGKYSKEKGKDKAAQAVPQGTLAERAGAAYGGALPTVGTAVGGLAGAGGGAGLGRALGGGRGAPAHQAAKVAGVDVALIRKLAEDAIYPSKVEAGPQVPPPATPAEQGMPPVPSDVRAQQRLVRSNQAAIDYDKGQAKEDPKSDLGKVLNEPALSSATDQILKKTLDHTQEAGVKISHVREDVHQVAAARALLSNMLEKVAAESCSSGSKDKSKKEKESMMGAAPTTPSSATGLTAASMG